MLPQVDPSRLELGPLLGRGASAKVYQASYMGELVAAKLFSPALDLDVLRREVRLIARLRHGSIISLRGMCLDPRSKDARGAPLGVCLVTQLARHGSIHSVLTNPDLKMLFRPWKQRLSFLADAACGMYYLHSQGPPVLHRDIKPGNVLVTEQLHALMSWIHEVKVAGARTLHPVRVCKKRRSVCKKRMAPVYTLVTISRNAANEHPITKGHSEGTSPQIAPTFLPNLGAPPR